MTDSGERSVTLILDRSALLAYVAGSIHASEPIGEVIRDGSRYGIPVVVAVETLAMVTGKDLANLHRLLGRSECAMLPVESDDATELTYWRRLTGRIDLACAALASHTYDDAPLLTGEGHRYDDQVPLIDMPE